MNDASFSINRKSMGMRTATALFRGCVGLGKV
jgi:hypothetical protein